VTTGCGCEDQDDKRMEDPVMYTNIEFNLLPDGVATVAIMRPHVLNAIDDATVVELMDLFERVAADDSIRALVFGSGSRGFCAGSDLDEAIEATPELHLYHWDIGQKMLRMLEDLPIPVVAAISGYAMGGGAEIALACDLRVASEDAKVGFPEVTIGGIPSWGGTQRLPKVVGQGNALELLLSGVPADARRAYEMGLFNRVVATGTELSAAVEWATLIAGRTPMALRAGKNLVRASAGVDREVGEVLEINWNVRCVAQPEFQERVGRFLAKRQRRSASDDSVR